MKAHVTLVLGSRLDNGVELSREVQLWLSSDGYVRVEAAWFNWSAEPDEPVLIDPRVATLSDPDLVGLVGGFSGLNWDWRPAVDRLIELGVLEDGESVERLHGMSADEYALADAEWAAAMG